MWFLNIPRETLLNYLKTVETLIARSIVRKFIVKTIKIRLFVVCILFLTCSCVLPINAKWTLRPLFVVEEVGVGGLGVCVGGGGGGGGSGFMWNGSSV